MKHNLGSLKGGSEACVQHSRQENRQRSFSAILFPPTHKSLPLKTVGLSEFGGVEGEYTERNGNM